MRKCEYCNRTEETHKIIRSKKFGMICERCNQRERLNPNRYELPEYGEVLYSPDDKPICHICGKAFDKLLSHARQVHRVSAREYKETFGLDTVRGIMSPESTELARQRALENYGTSIRENLLVGGEDSRFKIGCRGRTRDLVSEQTRRRLIKQLRINDGTVVEEDM